MHKFLFLIFLPVMLLCSGKAFATNGTGSKVRFIENKKQFPADVLFQADLPNGSLFLEKGRLTYNFLEKSYFDIESLEKANSAAEKQFKGHAFYVNFVNANSQAKLEPGHKLAETRNYFVGNNPANWSSNLGVYETLTYKNLFPGIELVLYTNAAFLKYDYNLQPQANPELIKMKYEGVNNLSINNGRLRIVTSVNEILEEKPYAYQEINGQQVEIPCVFTLENNTVGFKLTGRYDKGLPLVIDPALVFGTYTGSQNGMSANCTAVNATSNLHTAGYVLGTHYPVTSGAYKITGQYGNVVISKFNAAGSGLIYATFLGGNQFSNNDYPLALKVNQQDELIVLGHTSASDFPVTANAYDRFLGGQQDYFISKFSPNGTALLASTFYGGFNYESGSLSNSPAGLTLDNSGNIFICGKTSSSDIQIIGGFKTNLNGVDDGIAAKFNPNLSSLLWSSYFGTNANDVLSDIEIGASGKIYLAGYSTNFSPVGLQTTSGVIGSSPKGGTDAFIGVISPNGNQVLACTYIGTPLDDNVRFIELDAAENIYVIGYTMGSYPVTAGAYAYPATNRTAGYFIHKLNNSLTTTLFSTHIGSNSNSFFTAQSPTAFNVDDCENIYFAGYAPSQMYPTTANAFQASLRSIYMCQLAPMATNLIYGSFIGSGNGIGNHVHYANRSTITEDGHLYQIECTTGNDYPVTAGAFSSKVSGGGNDGAMIKFKFDAPVGSLLEARIQGPVVPGCTPYAVTFANNSTGGTSYRWNFGDGSPEVMQLSPTHTFTTPGNYEVKLIIGGLSGCINPVQTFDTATVMVLVKPKPQSPVNQIISCQGFAQLDAGNPGSTYVWFNGATTQTVLVNQPGDYQVTIDNGVCKTTASINVQFAEKRTPELPKTKVVLCQGAAELDAGNPGSIFKWSTGETTQTIVVDKPGFYNVEINNGFCTGVATVEVVQGNTLQAAPNIFTPDQDEFNENFIIPNLGQNTMLRMYNRWGKEVYSSNNYKNDWNGGKLAGGIYYYYLENPDSCEKIVKGWVEIVR